MYRAVTPTPWYLTHPDCAAGARSSARAPRGEFATERHPVPTVPLFICPQVRPRAPDVKSMSIGGLTSRMWLTRPREQGTPMLASDRRAEISGGVAEHPASDDTPAACSASADDSNVGGSSHRGAKAHLYKPLWELYGDWAERRGRSTSAGAEKEVLLDC